MAHHHHVGHTSKEMKGKNPDHGPAMIEGELHFDKGYESDHETFTNEKVYPDNHMRGNSYFALTNQAKMKDSGKLNRSKFSKFA